MSKVSPEMPMKASQRRYSLSASPLVPEASSWLFSSATCAS